MSFTEHQLLLSIYRLGDDAYGLAILKAVTEQSGREPSIGAIYVMLDQLEQKGLVESRFGEKTPERGGRAKKYFTLTDAGNDAIAVDLNVRHSPGQRRKLGSWFWFQPAC